MNEDLNTNSVQCFHLQSRSKTSRVQHSLITDHIVRVSKISLYFIPYLKN